MIIATARSNSVDLLNEVTQNIKERNTYISQDQNNMSSDRIEIRSSPQTIPVFQGYGAYYADIYIGSPPQRQTVMLDTGSEHVALPCTGCKNCGDTHTDRPFDPSASITYRELSCSECLGGNCSQDRATCNVSSRYVEGSSWLGLEIEDIIYSGGFHNEALDIQTPMQDDDDYFSGAIPSNALKYAYPLKFSCMKSNSGEFKIQKAAGIAGLNMKRGSLWKQMWDNGAISKKQFSICLRKHPFVSFKKEDRPVGTMTLGGIDDRLHLSEMVLMDLQRSDSGYYHVNIRKLLVIPGGGQRLRGDAPDLDLSRGLVVEDNERLMNRLGVIVDSGTTNTILAAELKPAFDQAWIEIMGFPFPEDAVDVSSEELKKWPTIIFQMKGSGEDAFVAFPSSSYMSLNLSTGQYTPSLLMHNEYGSSILGSNFMRYHNVLFDLERYLIGMAESNCDYQELITGTRSDLPEPYISMQNANNMMMKENMDSVCESEPFVCLVTTLLKISTTLLKISICVCLMAIVFSTIQCFATAVKQCNRASQEDDVQVGKAKQTIICSNVGDVLEHERLIPR